MTLDASGNLGVGTTSPSAPVDIQANSGGTGIRIRGRASANSGALRFFANDNTTQRARFESNDTSFEINSVANLPITISTNDTERARITSGGDFYVGRTTAVDSGKFIVQATANQEGVIAYCSNASQTASILQIRSARNTTNNSYYVINYYNEGAAVSRFLVADSGTVTNATGTYGTTPSERRFKQDIVDAPSQWDDIKNIKLRKYRMKSDVESFGDEAITQLGVIIDELEQVCPNLVEEHPVYEKREIEDENGNVTTEQVLVDTVKGWKTSIVHLKALKALQEAMTRIEQLEAKVAALENA
jgi:hypothetical protein